MKTKIFRYSMFLFVFVLFLSLFSLFGFAKGITTHLPAPPDGVNNFVVGYMPNLDTYRLGSTDYNGSIYISSDNGTLVNSDGDSVSFGGRYELVNGSWAHYSDSADWITWFDDIGSIDTVDGKVIIFSSNNFYGTNNQLLASAASDDVFEKGLSLIGNNISSSKLLSYFFSSFKSLIPVLFFVVVGIFAFYKGWRWLRVQLKIL